MADDMTRLVVSLEARVKQFENALAKANGTANKRARAIETRFAQMNTKVTGIFANFGKGLAGGALAALAPIALFNTALETINDASRLVETADKIGLTTDALQELSFGFAQVGVEASDFESSMEAFTKRVGEAATRGGKLADIFKANGVELRGANGVIRSSEDLLASYADLVKNAASEQEKLLLVTEGFGRGGGDMVNALNGGADAIRGMKKAAAEAGGVIDEQLLRRAEELGDRWDAAWRRFKIGSQSAILTAVQGLDELRNKFAAFEEAKNAVAAGTMVGSLAGKVPDGKGNRLTGADARVRDAFSGEIQKADDALVEALKKRYGDAANKATVIPGDKDDDSKGSGRNAAAEAALREAEAVLQVIESLQIERGLIGATDAERATANALRQAGTAATAEQRAEIEALVAAIYEEEEAARAAAETTQQLGDIALQAGDSLASALSDGKLEAQELIPILQDVIKQLIEMGAFSKIFGAIGGVSFGTPGGFAEMLGMASGGRVRGPGGPRSDKVPAMLSNGEYVVNAAAAGRNAGLLDAINSGRIAHMAMGGSVGIPSSGGRSAGTTVQIIDNAGVQKREERSRGPDGREMVKIILEKVKSDFATGGFDAPMKRYGGSPMKVQR